MKTSIAILDYGMGNLRSVAQAMRTAAPDANVVITGDPEVVRSAERIILPGQGAMPDCMAHLRESGLLEALSESAKTKPMLGVCVGEQMLFGHAEEGNSHGLGWFAGDVVRFRVEDAVDESGAKLKVPHMGWNTVRQTQAHALWAQIPDQTHFYFVHSYYVSPFDDDLTVGESVYGAPFTCASDSPAHDDCTVPLWYRNLISEDLSRSPQAGSPAPRWEDDHVTM